MKKDIEILEVVIENSRYSFENFGEYESLDKSTMEAIENLIKGYKELVERNHYLVQERMQYEQMLFKSKEHYIEKDKVREKLEENNLPLTIVGGRRYGKTLEYGIKLGREQVLKELLEE